VCFKKVDYIFKDLWKFLYSNFLLVYVINRLTKKKNMYSNVSMFSTLVAMLSNYGIYWYISRLEKLGCECSDTLQRSITKNFLLLNFILIIGSYLTQSKMPKVLSVLYGTYGLFMLINTFLYLHKLKTEKCECSKHLIRDVYYYFYMIRLLLIILMLALMISLLLFVTTVYIKKKL